MAANQAEVDLVVNAAGALPDLERQLSQIVRTAENTAPEVDVQASLAVQHSIAVMSTQLDQALNAVDQTNPTIDVSAALDTRESLRQLRADVDQLTRLGNSGLFDPVELQAQLDFAGSLAEITTDLEHLVSDAERTAEVIRIEAELDEERVERLRQRFDSLVRGLGRGARTGGAALGTLGSSLTKLIIVGGTAANTLVAVGAAAQQIAPAAAVGTSAMLTMRLAAGTLKLAMIGVQEGIENVFNQDLTASEFHKSIEGLAPEARLFVDEIHTMRRELRAVQQEVQNRVFKDFDEVLRSVATQTGPQIRTALNRTADALNAMGRNAANAAVQLSKQGVLGQALEGATSALETLEKVPARAVRSFGFLAAASAPALNRIALAIDEVSLKVQNKLQRAFESGALERAIDKAVSTLAQLGRVLGNFAAGVGNIFGGLTQNGRGLFQILEDISEGFERLTASKEFQTILGELALTADALVQNILPLVQEAFVQLAPVIEELAPIVREFITAIGPELIPIIQQLGPILVDIALVLKDQLPLAIELTKAALVTLGVALTLIHGLFENVILPASRKVAEFFNSDLARAFKFMGDSAAGAVSKGIDEFLKFRTRVNEAVNEVVSAVGRFAGDLKDKFVAGVVSATVDAIRAFEDFKREAAASVRELPGEMFSIGVDIMNGLAGGMTSGISRIVGIARDIANSVSSTIDDALEIFSPSRVLRRSGRFAAEGLALGLKDGLLGVERAAKALTDPFFVPSAFRRQVGLTGREARFRAPLGALATQPVVNVYVGNELLNQFINNQVRVTLGRRDRTLSQGLRI